MKAGAVRPTIYAHRPADLYDGAVVIAAITSCTNTSNPSVLVGAGLVARKALQRGLRDAAVGEDVARARLKSRDRLPRTRRSARRPRRPRLQRRRLRLHDVHRQLRAAFLSEVAEAIADRDLIVASVLSGNRNFEGRIHAQVRANYLASPPLVVAYALAGRMDIDLDHRAAGVGNDGKPVYSPISGRATTRSLRRSRRTMGREMFAHQYGTVFEGDQNWHNLEVAHSERYQWDPQSEYVKRPPYFDGMPDLPGAVGKTFEGARAIVVLGDSVTTDHISRAGNIIEDQSCGRISHAARGRAVRVQLVRRASRQS